MTQYMTNSEAVDYLKDQLEDYLNSECGIVEPRKDFICLNPAHDDQHPSMKFYEKGRRVKCFSCEASYDIFELVEIQEGIHGFYNQLQHLCDIYDIEIIKGNAKKPKAEASKKPKKEASEAEARTDYTEYFRTCYKNRAKCSYLTDRGISKELQERFKIGYDEAYKVSKDGKYTWQAVIIPNGKYSYVARNISPNADAKNRYRKTGKSKLFNFKASTFNAEAPIFIVEGEIDALSIIEAGGQAIALGSTSNVEQLASKLIENVPADKCPPLIMCLDVDTAGQEAQIKADVKLKGAGFFTIGANKGENPIFKDCKDANELLIKDRETLIKQVEYWTKHASLEADKQRLEQLEAYKKQTTAGASLNQFIDGIKAGASTVFIPTGYKYLDEALDGGITEGLYIMGAISSLGKTTYILQMGDQIAKNGTDVLIFSLEMSKNELMAKSISRNTFLMGDVETAKTTRGITTTALYKNYSAEDKELISNAVKEYSSYAGNVYITEGMGDVGYKQIREAVTKHIQLTKNKPVVIIDYVQLLAPHNERATDKQNTDKAILELKRLSRDYKIPIIGISSFNRQSYTGEVNMSSFKESGAIEYGSDVLIGLQLKRNGDEKVNEAEAKAVSNDVRRPREIELKILKNRNGRTGLKLNYNFYSAFNYFAEEGDTWAEPLKPAEGYIKEFEDDTTDFFDTSDIEDL